MPRWNKKETECIAIVKERLRDEIAASPQYPEVVGERKIIRFLRGHDYAVDKVCELMSNFLKWRISSNVNEIRKNIVEGEANHPLRFPKGELILSLIPSLVLAPDALDTEGAPICVDQYNFSPTDVLTKISLEDYIVFVTHVLEYRSAIIEQMSEERERAFLNSLTPEERAAVEDPQGTSEPYGVIVNTCVIRDLGAVGFEHLGARGMEIIKAVITLASDNYPELMRKCYMINTPWVFNAVWYVVKGFLAAKTIAKVSVMGASFQDELQKEIRPEYFPKIIGGPYVGYSEYIPFAFDTDYLCPVEGKLSAAGEPPVAVVPAAAIEVPTENNEAQEEPAAVETTSG